jgi:hypothetical protein
VFVCTVCSQPSRPREKPVIVPTFRPDRSIAREEMQHAACAGVVVVPTPETPRPIKREETRPLKFGKYVKRQLRARGAMTSTPWRDVVRAVS